MHAANAFSYSSNLKVGDFIDPKMDYLLDKDLHMSPHELYNPYKHWWSKLTGTELPKTKMQIFAETYLKSAKKASLKDKHLKATMTHN